MILTGKRGVIFGASNKYSIAWGIAKQFIKEGAIVLFSVKSSKEANKVSSLLHENGLHSSVEVCDLSDESSLLDLKEKVANQLGTIDFIVHSVAYAQKDSLNNHLLNITWEDFSTAIQISCYSFINIIRTFQELLNDNGSILTLSYIGSHKVIPGYDVMGVAKAALESTVKYVSYVLGERNIKVNVLSPGPINTVSARGIKGLKDLIKKGQESAPLKEVINIDIVSKNAVYLVSDFCKGVTGQVIYVDSGYHVMGIL